MQAVARMYRRGVSRLPRLVLGALLLAACLSAEQGPVSTTPTQAATTSVAPSTSTSGGPDPTVASTTTSTLDVDIEISGGHVIGPALINVARGEHVSIWVRSDVADAIHVHGYDLFFELTPRVPIHIEFLADVPGIFEAELEATHMPVFDIEVTG